MRNYTVNTAASHLMVNGALGELQQYGPYWGSVVDAWQEGLYTTLVAANNACEMAQQRGDIARKRLQFEEEEVKAFKAAAINVQDLPSRLQLEYAMTETELLKKRDQTREDVSDAAKALRLAIYKRERLLDTTCRASQRIEMDRAPQLCSTVAQFVQVVRAVVRAGAPAVGWWQCCGREAAGWECCGRAPPKHRPLAAAAATRLCAVLGSMNNNTVQH